MPRNEAGDIERLRESLGIPSESFLYSYPIEGYRLNPKWAEYKAELLTIAGAASPWKRCPRSWTVMLPGATTPRTIVRWRAWKVGRAGYLTLTWNPRYGEWVEIRGPRTEVRERSLDTFLGLVRTHVGRPPGTKRPDPQFPKRYRDALVAIFGGGQTDIPNYGEIAAAIGCSESTAQRQVKFHKLPWPPPWPPGLPDII